MSINGHKTGIQDVKERTGIQDVKERKEKYIRTSLHPSKSIHTPPIKKLSYTNSPLKYKTTFIQNYFPFLSRMTKGKSPRGRHLVITRRAHHPHQLKPLEKEMEKERNHQGEPASGQRD